MAEDDGFLSRWSRRKQLARSGQPLPPAPLAEASERSAPVAFVPSGVPPTPVAPDAALAPAADAALPAGTPAPSVQDEAREPVRLPTLDDVARLTPDADFSPFVARGVPSDVKNAALKKLFADPRYNVMDGMDVYIDDYSQPDPLPLAMARKLASAQFMKLFDEPEQQAVPAHTAEAETSPPAPALTEQPRSPEEAEAPEAPGKPEEPDTPRPT